MRSGYCDEPIRAACTAVSGTRPEERRSGYVTRLLRAASLLRSVRDVSPLGNISLQLRSSWPIVFPHKLLFLTGWKAALFCSILVQKKKNNEKTKQKKKQTKKNVASMFSLSVYGFCCCLLDNIFGTSPCLVLGIHEGFWPTHSFPRTQSTMWVAKRKTALCHCFLVNVHVQLYTKHDLWNLLSVYGLLVCTTRFICNLDRQKFLWNWPSECVSFHAV